eukprot:15688644-Heterocapsa_arctica.AAC.1
MPLSFQQLGARPELSRSRLHVDQAEALLKGPQRASAVDEGGGEFARSSTSVGSPPSVERVADDSSRPSRGACIDFGNGI